MMQQSISNQIRIQGIANPISIAIEGPSRDHVVWFRIDGNGHYQMVNNRQHGDIQRARNGNYSLNREHFLLGELRFGLNYNDNRRFPFRFPFCFRPILYVIVQRILQRKQNCFFSFFSINACTLSERLSKSS